MDSVDGKKSTKNKGLNGGLAEREGFEPPIRLPVCRISSAVHSTALPPLRGAERGVFAKNPATPDLCNEAAGARQGGRARAAPSPRSPGEGWGEGRTPRTPGTF